MDRKGISRSVDVISVKSYIIIVNAVIVDYKNTQEWRLPVPWKHLLCLSRRWFARYQLLAFYFSWECVLTHYRCVVRAVSSRPTVKSGNQNESLSISLWFFCITRGEIDIITMSAITPSRLVEKSFRRNKKRSFPLVMRCNFLKIRLSMREIVSKWTQPYLRLEYLSCFNSACMGIIKYYIHERLRAQEASKIHWP